MMKTLSSIVLCLRFHIFVIFALALIACDNNPPPKIVDMSIRGSHPADLAATDTPTDKTHHYKFGFNLRSSHQEDAKQYLSFLDYLSAATGYHFELVLTSKEEQLDQQLGLGIVHFAAIGAVTHIQTHEYFSVIPLARGLNSEGKAEYQSVIIVRPDSPINTLAHLKGTRFAFGRADATQGHLIPRIELLEHDIALTDFSKYTYTSSHQACANTIITEKYDACAMQDTMGDTLARQGLVKIIHRSRYYPSSGISANKDLPAEVIATVRQALLDFEPNGKDAVGLYEWSDTEMPNGFTVANDDQYAPLRSWMIRLGLLNMKKTGE